MNKVLNINLGGFPFTIDEDAYNHLHRYLQTIHNHFKSSDGYEEITTDIETRLAELLRERLSSHTIVHLKDVTAVISTMGTPADFGADEEPAGKEKTNGQRSHKTGKRLFRHPDDTVLGGVCAGIAAYLGIQDPLWIRLAFVAFFFFGGFAVPLYIILWIIVPKAASASDKLAMRGDPVNANNIGKIIEEELSHVSRKVSELGDELKAEFKSSGSKHRTGHSDGPATGFQSIRNAVQEMLRLAGAVLLAVLNFLRKTIKPITFAVGLILVITLGITWIGLVAGTFVGSPFLSFILPGKPLLYALAIINILALVGIPLLMLILGVMRIFMRTHFKPKWVLGLWIFWGLNVMCISLLSSSVLRDFQTDATPPPASQKSFMDVDTLSIEMVDAYSDFLFLHFGDKLRMAGDNLLSSNVSVNIQRSDTNTFEIVQSNSSRGRNAADGAAAANAIQYNWRINGNRLLLDDAFTIPDGTPWRGQKVNLTVKIPENKWLAFDRRTKGFLGTLTLDQDKPSPPRRDFYRYTWQMGPYGLFTPDFSDSSND
ncbi:MAG: hypothetical protein RLY31_492 [Bacteroidota bacterium]|jgi:phage shock protein C